METNTEKKGLSTFEEVLERIEKRHVSLLYRSTWTDIGEQSVFLTENSIILFFTDGSQAEVDRETFKKLKPLSHLWQSSTTSAVVQQSPEEAAKLKARVEKHNHEKEVRRRKREQGVDYSIA